MKLLLDLNVIVRHAQGKLPRRIIRLFDRLRTELLVSVVTPWEIAMKPEVVRTGFKAQHLNEHLQTIGASILPITLAHIAEFETLPAHHDDPFDRMIIAQAIVENCTVVSSDQRFPLYARAGLEVFWDA